MFHLNDVLFPALGPVWRAFDMLDQLDEERNPDRLDHQIRADEEQVRVVIMLPGLDRDQLVVEVDDDVLRIRAHRRDLTPEQAKILRRERERADYERLIRLPYAVDDSQATADYENGVLTVNLPRAAASKPHRISISGTKAIEQA